MGTLSHPNVVNLFGFVEDMDKADAWILLNWEPNGNVREFLRSGEWEIPERISLVGTSTPISHNLPNQATGLDSRRCARGWSTCIPGTPQSATVISSR